LDRSWFWEFVGRIYEEGLDVGWLTRIGYDGEVLAIPKRGWRINFGPCPGTKAWLLSFNRTQCRAVTGLLTGHNAVNRQLHIMGRLSVQGCDWPSDWT